MTAKAKTEPANPNFSKSRPKDKDGLPSPGWKQCSKCQGWNKGVRRAKCEGCGEPFPTAQAKPQAKTASQAPAVKSNEVIRFIQEAGGLSNAQAILTQVEAVESMGGVGVVHRVVVWLQEAGGLKQAEPLLVQADVIRNLGGVQAVRHLVSQWQAIRSLPE